MDKKGYSLYTVRRDLTLPVTKARGFSGGSRMPFLTSVVPQSSGCVITPPKPVHIAA